MTEFLVAMLWSVVEVLIVFTGAQVVRVVGLGRWRSERWGSNEARTWSAAGALSFRHEGQRSLCWLSRLQGWFRRDCG